MPCVATRPGCLPARSDHSRSVPTSLLISIENARATPGLGEVGVLLICSESVPRDARALDKCAQVLKEFRKELDQYSTLALFILFEYEKGAAGFFWPYLCSLPKPGQYLLQVPFLSCPAT